METVKIGNRNWTLKNLSVDRFRNNEIIPEAKSAEEWIEMGYNKKAAWCYVNNDPNNGNKYGKLYNWFAVNDERGLAPLGFRISNMNDWDDLVKPFGGQHEAGHKLRALNEFIYDDNATNKSGFNGLPGGLRNTQGLFKFNREYGYWWLIDHFGEDAVKTFQVGNFDIPFSSCAFFQCISARSKEVIRRYLIKESGLSVRCVKE